MLKNETVKRWGVDPEELIRTAMANTERLLPMEMKPLDDVVAEIMEKSRHEIPEEARKYFENEMNMEVPKVCLVTNRARLNGFSAVFYRDVLKRLAERFSSDLYILPCSIHEALVLPADEKVKAGNLADIVAEVNRECVVPEEYLSDSVYYYDYMQDDFRIVATTRATKTGYMDPDRIENSVG